MTRTHFLYMNGQHGCIPDSLELYWNAADCAEHFEFVFGDDLYQGFNLATAVEQGVIAEKEVVVAVENFLGDDLDDMDDDEFEGYVGAFLQDGAIERSDGVILEAIEEFGETYVKRVVEMFEETGYIDLGPKYGAAYAQWTTCNCQEPWIHTEDPKDVWLHDNREWEEEE